MVLSGLYNASVQNEVLPVIVVKHKNASIASCDIVSVRLNMIMKHVASLFQSEWVYIFNQIRPNLSL